MNGFQKGENEGDDNAHIESKMSRFKVKIKITGLARLSKGKKGETII